MSVERNTVSPPVRQIRHHKVCNAPSSLLKSVKSIKSVKSVKSVSVCQRLSESGSPNLISYLYMKGNLINLMCVACVSVTHTFSKKAGRGMIPDLRRDNPVCYRCTNRPPFDRYTTSAS